MRRVPLLFLFLAVLTNCSRPGKDEIINDFMNSLKSRDIIQCKTKFIMTNKGSRPRITEGLCTYKIVPGDTVIGAYYNIRSDDNIRVYNGNEYLNYYPEYYEDSVVNLITKKNSPEKFSFTEIEMDGKKYYEPPVVSSFLFDVSPVGVMKEINKYKDKGTWKTLPDTTINGYECRRIGYFNTGKTDSVEYNNYYIYAFDRGTNMPVYLYFYDPRQQRETFLNDYRFDSPGAVKLFTRNAFPGYLKIVENAPFRKKESLKEGTEAPAWTESTVYGGRINSESLKGKPTLLEFSSINCAPCQWAVKDLNEIKKEHPEYNILAVYPVDSKEAIRDYISLKKINYDILCDSGGIKKEFLVSGYPTFFFIDKKGVIYKSWAGYGDNGKENLLKTLKEMD